MKREVEHSGTDSLVVKVKIAGNMPPEKQTRHWALFDCGFRIADWELRIWDVRFGIGHRA